MAVQPHLGLVVNAFENYPGALPALGGRHLKAVRYHHGWRVSVSGMCRLFRPMYGSGYTPWSMSVVSTVPGTVALYQLALLNAARLMAAPAAGTWPAAASSQP